MKVYDSVYRTLDRATKSIISNLFQTSTSTELVLINRQTGGRDCAVYAIAISTALSFRQDPTAIKFDQPAMRSHLVACFEKGTFSPFPMIWLSTHLYMHYYDCQYSCFYMAYIINITNHIRSYIIL